jgi:hypothetical protein
LEAKQAPAAVAKAKDSTNAVSILLIIACILAIGAVGYLAWQRGLIGRIAGIGGQGGQVTSAEAVDIWADAPPAPARFKRRTQSARVAIDHILATTATTNVTFDQAGALTAEAVKALDKVAEQGNDWPGSTANSSRRWRRPTTRCSANMRSLSATTSSWQCSNRWTWLAWPTAATCRASTRPTFCRTAMPR